MGNYRNFNLSTYFVAQGSCNETKEHLEKSLKYFERYLRLDKVYLEPFRDSNFATDEQIRMIKGTLEEHGLDVDGGITTCMKPYEGGKPKQRLFNTFCYTDPVMLEQLRQVSKFNGEHFKAFIIDDFYFTNCTCETCRKAKDEYNKANNITDGSWERFRCDLMYKVSLEYMIKPAKEANPDCKITIKYPNWMESYQETGYDPLKQKDIFDFVYTGTETRDPLYTDQHLPRYLSFSLMRWMENMAPGRNGGGWFDPYDCRMLDYYLEQAYLTLFSKPRELMMFCFQSLDDSMQIPPLGLALDKADALLDNLGEPVGVMCYIPNYSQGEDNVQDFLGMHGFPIIPTPFFPEKAACIMLTESSLYDSDVINKLKAYVAKGGKAILTSGFVKKGLECGLKDMTSIRYRGREATVIDYMAETDERTRYVYPYGKKAVTVPVLEFRNNSTWGALCKGIRDEEACTLFAEDTYGEGQIYTLNVPTMFSDIQYYPKEVLTRMRRECRVNGVFLEGNPWVSLFVYDNDTVALYPYVDRNTHDDDMYLHAVDTDKLIDLMTGSEVEPLYKKDNDSVFRLRTRCGSPLAYKLVKSGTTISEKEVIIRSDRPLF